MLKGILGGFILFASIAVSWASLLLLSFHVGMKEIERTNPFKAEVSDWLMIFSHLIYPLSGIFFAFAPKFLPSNIASFKNAMIFYSLLPIVIAGASYGIIVWIRGT